MCRVVKLADFGTSFFDGAESAKLFGVEQGASVNHTRFYTTLENTPIDFLILGTCSKQGFEADTWCLGLSFVHLLTGGQPYEEIMENCKCPAELREALNHLWDDDKERYHVLSDLNVDYPNILHDTFYRYLVLLGFDLKHKWPESWKKLKVFKILSKYLLSTNSISAQFQARFQCCLRNFFSTVLQKQLFDYALCI
jgi:serine/threonine protein kinase